jgi:hypothetical protein
MPGWLVGVMWTVVVIIWVIAGVDIFNRENKDLFS